MQRRTKDIFKKNIASYSKQPSVPDLMLSASNAAVVFSELKCFIPLIKNFLVQYGNYPVLENGHIKPLEIALFLYSIPLSGSGYYKSINFCSQDETWDRH